jgi:HSP20 family protein
MSWNPLQDLVQLQERMNRLFEDVTQHRSHGEADGGDELERPDWYPAADVYERDLEFIIAIDLPGIDRNALKLDVDENRLVVRGERRLEKAKGARTERQSGTFLRTFGVPAAVDQNKISANYKDGVLEIHLPRQTVTPRQRVEIRVS